jgi:hypothetical protein
MASSAIKLLPAEALDVRQALASIESRAGSAVPKRCAEPLNWLTGRATRRGPRWAKPDEESRSEAEEASPQLRVPLRSSFARGTCISGLISAIPRVQTRGPRRVDLTTSGQCGRSGDDDIAESADAGARTCEVGSAENADRDFNACRRRATLGRGPATTSRTVELRLAAG